MRALCAFRTALAVALLLSNAGARAADATSGGDAAAVVERLHETLLEVMKRAEELGYVGRRERLEPVLKEVIDIPFMAEKSVGRHWKNVQPEQREELLETFSRFTVANYAGRFNGYSGQRFETLGQEPSLRGTVIVRTQLVSPDGQNVQLDYRLWARDGDWKIVDVYLNGTVSEIALRRSEYSSLIEREGFGALLQALERKIGELASGKYDGEI